MLHLYAGMSHIYIYKYIYLYIYMSIYLYINIYIHIYIYMQPIQIYKSICYTSVPVWVKHINPNRYTYKYICKYTYRYIYKHIYVYINIHTYIYATYSNIWEYALYLCTGMSQAHRLFKHITRTWTHMGYNDDDDLDFTKN
jgi:hypothetical protein